MTKIAEMAASLRFFKHHLLLWIQTKHGGRYMQYMYVNIKNRKC